MTKCVIVTIACWISATVWLSWATLVLPNKNSFDRSEIGMAVCYVLCPLTAAAGAAIFLGRRFATRWLSRGLCAGVVSSGIVVLFLAQTRPSGTEIRQVEIAATLVFEIAGFLIGISAPRVDCRSDNPLLH